MAEKKRPSKRKRESTRPRLVSVDLDLEAALDQLDEALLNARGEPPSGIVDNLVTRRELPDTLVKRLLSGRAKVPLIALELITFTAGQRAPTLLRRVAASPLVPDVVRFGAHRRAGWPARGEKKRRLAFLDTLQDPEGTLVQVTQGAADSWPWQNEVIEETLRYLDALPATRRHSVVTRIASELGTASTWLLRAVLQLRDPAAQRLALDALVRLREPGTAAVIERLALTASSATVRSEASAALQRLGLHAADVAAPHEPRALPPIHQVLVSPFDMVGGQVILATRQLVEGTILLVNVFHDRESGIKDTFGVCNAPHETIESFVEGFAEQELELVEVDLAVARGAVAAGLEVNAALRRALPQAFEVWEPLLHDTYPPSPEEAIVRPELDDAPFANRPDLVSRSGALLDDIVFETWRFDGDETTLAMLGAPPPTSSRWSNRQVRPLITQLMDDQRRTDLRILLRRQAWLLQHRGDETMRDLALATAAHIAEAPLEQLVSMPFLRGLVQRSVAAVLIPGALSLY